ncbi:hypothetical protein FGIG_04086 [Fasciola gigantica]|uniref:Uncharacterized protein n=1 Tax=Fasciola gigantica TaxID=46835 RepID=A0A504YKT9_FASGI|nr:hypothetical protein FGIG_04086 [Fasciola gigantica]
MSITSRQSKTLLAKRGHFRFVYSEKGRGSTSSVLSLRSLSKKRKSLDLPTSGKSGEKRSSISTIVVTQPVISPKKKVHFRSKEEVGSGKEVSKKAPGTDKRRRRKESQPYLYEDTELPKEQLTLMVQTQDELVRNLTTKSVVDLVQKEILPDSSIRTSPSTVIQPLDIHLLKAKSGRITYDLADYIGREMVGKQVTSKGLDLFAQSREEQIRSPAFESLIQSGLHWFTVRDFNISTLAWECVRKCGARVTELYQNLPTMKMNTKPTVRKSKAFGGKKSTKKTQEPKRPYYFLTQNSEAQGSHKMEDLFSNLMGEDMESYKDEDLLSEEDLITMLQIDVADEWDMSSHEKQAKRKQSRVVTASTKPPKAQMQKSRSGSLNSVADTGALMQKIQLSDVQAMNTEMQTAEGRVYIRRLIGLLAAECAPKAIYRKYAQEHRIVFDFENLSPYHQYGPRVIQRLKEHLMQIAGQTQVILNDHQVMETLTRRIGELYKVRP